METFSALLAICTGIHKRQWRVALMFSLICAGINGWVNNREAGDLRRQRAHYDVIVMLIRQLQMEEIGETIFGYLNIETSHAMV